MNGRSRASWSGPEHGVPGTVYRPLRLELDIPSPESPDARIAFDHFHVAQHLGAAVDQVRRREHKALRTAGDDSLKRTRYLWLQSPGSMTRHRRDALALPRQANLMTARAWAIREHASCLMSFKIQAL